MGKTTPFLLKKFDQDPIAIIFSSEYDFTYRLQFMRNKFDEERKYDQQGNKDAS
jgi:hypothetical protein